MTRSNVAVGVQTSSRLPAIAPAKVIAASSRSDTPPSRSSSPRNVQARAAELATLPDDEVLAVYTALRPRRATAGELETIAEHLLGAGAPRCAAFVREAAAVLAERGLLRSDA